MISQFISYRNIQISRKTSFLVSTSIFEYYNCRIFYCIECICIKYLTIESMCSPMNRMTFIIFFQMICLSIQTEFGISNSIGKSSDCSAEFGMLS